jgi:hypothetical protein
MVLKRDLVLDTKRVHGNPPGKAAFIIVALLRGTANTRVSGILPGIVVLYDHPMIDISGERGV